MGIIKLFIAGGFFMWPILFCSVMALALVIYETIILMRFHKASGVFFSYIASGGKAGSPEFVGLSAEELAAPSPRVKKLVEDRVQLAFDKVNKPIELISGDGNLAPLLGFIGTVSGMISSFAAIAAADKVSVNLVAAGISEALITTGFGLCVAILCMFSEMFFRYYLAHRAHFASERLDLFLGGDEE
jgi:biopolymer transport protein ExbB